MKYQILAGVAVVLFGANALAQQAPANAAPVKPAASAPAAAVSTPKTEARDQYIVIGYLKKQDSTVTIKSGPSGPVYSVTDKNGKVIHENLSAEQLKAKAPEVHQLIKTGFAADSAVYLHSARLY